MSTVNLGCRLDLKQIALHARNAEYNPKVRNGEGRKKDGGFVFHGSCGGGGKKGILLCHLLMCIGVCLCLIAFCSCNNEN